MGFRFFSNTFIIESKQLDELNSANISFYENIIEKLKDLFISEIFLWLDYFERTWIWSEPVSTALESDHSLIKVWAMVSIWVWTMDWRVCDQNASALKSLIRDPLFLESLIRGNLVLESLIRINFRLKSLIRDTFGLENWSVQNLNLDLNLGTN